MSDLRKEVDNLEQLVKEKIALKSDIEARLSRMRGRPVRLNSARKSIIDQQYLYFILCGDAVKIGRAKDPNVRMRELQTGAPGTLTLLASFERAGYLESLCHKLLAEQRLSGEWFIYDSNVEKIIRDITTGEIA